MPELPEIEVFCKHVRRSLKDKVIKRIEILKPNISDISERKFTSRVKGKIITGANPHGKWAYVELDDGAHILINNSMGADMLLVDSEKIASDGRYEAAIYFDNGKALKFKYWWLYGKIIYMDKKNSPTSHKLTSGLGIHAYGRKFTINSFAERLDGKKGKIKQFLLSQRNFAGIGNAYIHDIMFRAKIHPHRNISSLSDEEIEGLHSGITDTFADSIQRGGAFWEKNIYGRQGGFDRSRMLIAYSEGKPCPECGRNIQKIKTGSTTGFICPQCQRI